MPRLFRLRNRSRADPGPVVPIPDHIRFQQDGRPDPLDPRTIPPQWRRLASLDPRSHDYDELLRTLVEVEGNRKAAMKATDKDAGIVINIIGEALGSGRLQEKQKLANHCFIVLRKLVGNTGQLPDNYLVSKGPGFQVEGTIFACGGFADVRRGMLDDKVVAVKTIRVAEDSNFPAIRKDFCKESVIWMNTSHPNILELLAVNIDPKSGALSMVSELMENGNIMDYIRVNEANRIRLLDDVVRGLSYLHKCGIVHGDLKGSNILIKNGANPQACISDFGLSTLTSTMSFAVSVTGDESKGTLSHMAPELLYPGNFGLRTCRISKQADIYAIGMVIYEVLTGRLPFGAERRQHAEIVVCVLEGKRPREPERAGDIGFGGGTWELIQQCWHQDREERPTVEKVSKHFHRVAKTSSIIPPGPTTPVFEAEAPTASEPNSSRDFARLFVPASMGTSIIRQARLTADLMSGGNVHSSLSVPGVQLVPTKLSFFERIGARIMGRRPALRLGAPKSPFART